MKITFFSLGMLLTTSLYAEELTLLNNDEMEDPSSLHIIDSQGEENTGDLLEEDQSFSEDYEPVLPVTEMLQPSPYAPEAQKEKVEKVLKEYFESRDTLGEGVGNAMMEETESPTSADDVDGVEPPSSPNEHDVTKPIDPHAQVAQKALVDEVKSEDLEEDLGESLARKATGVGGPGSVRELAAKEAEDKGHFSPGPELSQFQHYANPAAGWVGP